MTQEQLPAASHVEQPFLPSIVATHDAAEPAQQLTHAHAHLLATLPPSRSVNLATILTAVWVAGALVVGLYRVVGVALALRLQRRSTPYFGNIESTMRTAELRLPVTVLVNSCSSPSVPMTWGIRRPIVMLPDSVGEWPDRQVESVLLHELGHVRRMDMLTLTLASVACAIYWFNPLMWLAVRAMRFEAEGAADDFALSAGRAPPSTPTI